MDRARFPATLDRQGKAPAVGGEVGRRPVVGAVRLTGRVAAAGAALFAVLALVWTLTGSGFPFDVNDPDRDTSLLRNLPAEVGAPAYAVLMLGTAVAALAMSGEYVVRPRGAARVALLTAGWFVVALLLVVSDMSVLTLLGYAPMLILGAPFGWPDVDYGDLFTWSLLNKAAAVAVGVLLARTLLGWQVRTRADVGVLRWAAPASAARWGLGAAYVAAAVPVVYTLTRFAWLLRIPLGIDRAKLDELWDSGAPTRRSGVKPTGGDDRNDSASSRT